jgi:hypothetical protein
LPLSSGATFSNCIVCLQLMQVIKSNSGLRSSFIDLLHLVYPHCGFSSCAQREERL